MHSAWIEGHWFINIEITYIRYGNIDSMEFDELLLHYKFDNKKALGI